MAPFPIALCGKNPMLASSFVERMNQGSEFEVVTVFNTTDQATTELKSLLEDNKTRPASGSGSNATSESCTAPKAVVVGAGFSTDELEAMRQSVSTIAGARKLAWFTPARSQAQRPGQPGFMEGVVSRAKDALREQRDGSGEVEAGVHGF